MNSDNYYYGFNINELRIFNTENIRFNNQIDNKSKNLLTSKNIYESKKSDLEADISKCENLIQDYELKLSFVKNQIEKFPDKSHKTELLINNVRDKYINDTKNLKKKIYKNNKVKFIEKYFLDSFIDTRINEFNTNVEKMIELKKEEEIINNKEQLDSSLKDILNNLKWEKEKKVRKLNDLKNITEEYNEEKIKNESILNSLKDSYASYCYNFYLKQKQYFSNFKYDNIFTGKNKFDDKSNFDDILFGFSQLNILKFDTIEVPIKYSLKAYNFTKSKIDDLLLDILNVILYFPSHYLNIIPIDINGYGKNLSYLRKLLPIEDLFPYNCVTNLQQLTHVINKIQDKLTDDIQKLMIDNISDLIRYNNENPQNIIPINLIVLFGSVDNIVDQNTLMTLISLFENGISRGFFPIFEKQEKIEKKYINDLRDKLVNIINSQKSIKSTEELPHINSQFFELINPKSSLFDIADSIDSLINRIIEIYSVKQESVKYDMNDMLEEKNIWKYKSIDDINIEVGKDIENGTPIQIKLGANSINHMLIAGMTGSGKTNFIHVLINSIMYRYSPDDVQIFILDLKEGTDFNIYAFEKFPYTKVVALGESSLDYCTLVLHRLLLIMEQRGEYFRDIKVSDYSVARRKQPNKILPRILVIIDEFQTLLKDNKIINSNVAILNQLCRKGRSAGIHIILSTQTLRGLNEFNSLLTQVPCRVAFKCNSEDSGQVLGHLNNDGATAIKQIGQCIINYDNGDKDKNISCVVPLAKDIDTHIDNICKHANLKNISNEAVVYASNILPSFNEINDEEFDSNQINIFLGKTFNFAQNLNKIVLSKDLYGNLLIDGYHKTNKDRIIISIFNSLSKTDCINNIYYLDAYNKQITGENKYSRISERIKYIKDIKEIDSNKKSIVLINNIDGLLNPGISNNNFSKIMPLKGSISNISNSSESNFLNNQLNLRVTDPEKKLFVIGFTNDYLNINRDLIKYFNLRIELIIEKNRLTSYLPGLITNNDKLCLSDNNICYIGNLLKHDISACRLFKEAEKKELNYDLI